MMESNPAPEPKSNTVAPDGISANKARLETPSECLYGHREQPTQQFGGIPDALGEIPADGKGMFLIRVLSSPPI